MDPDSRIKSLDRIPYTSGSIQPDVCPDQARNLIIIYPDENSKLRRNRKLVGGPCTSDSPICPPLTGTWVLVALNLSRILAWNQTWNLAVVCKLFISSSIYTKYPPGGARARWSRVTVFYLQYKLR